MRVRVSLVASLVVALGVLEAARAQPPAGSVPGAPVDFATVRPIFLNRCVSCHGASVQRAGLRLDERAGAMKGSASGPVIIPGDAAGSRLYQMVVSKKMPLDDELSILELGALKAWIDGGAVWPEKRTIPGMVVDPKVEAFRLALRAQDRTAISALLADPALAKARGKNGTTALHQASIYGTAADVRALLDAGADVNAADLDGVTPLIWGVHDDAVANLLIDRGANVNAVSDAATSPLSATAGRNNGVALMKRLIEKGAKAAPPQQPAIGAAVGIGGNLAMVQAVFPAVVPVSGPGAEIAAANTINANCLKCLDYLIAQGARGPTLKAALVMAANSGDAALVKRLLDLGATLDGRGPQDATALIAAAVSDREPAQKVGLLVAAGADVNVPDAHGRTPLYWAKQVHPEIAPVLVAKGAK